jgi:hypothetical protein
MKRYYLDVITGNDFGVDYEVEADGYEYSECGFYRFYVKENKDIRWTETVASYPINRTIIKRIIEI